MTTALMRSITDTGNSKHVQSAFENEKNVTYVGNFRGITVFCLEMFHHISVWDIYFDVP